MGRTKNKNLLFVPQSINFADLPRWQHPSMEDEQGYVVEQQILQMIYSLETDKDRCVLLLTILREYGFNFDHQSSARALHINWRWYMRIKERIAKRLKPFLINAI